MSALIAGKVREFHERYGHPVRDVPGARYPEGSFRVRLVNEELAELKEGYASGDVVGVADGLGDLSYVTYGSALVFGLDITSGDLPFEVPEPAEVLSLENLQLRTWVEAVEGYAGLFADAVRSADLPTIQFSLRRLQWAVEGMAATAGIDLDAVVTEIHRSNMTKIPNGQDKPIKKDGVFSEPNLYAVLYGTAAVDEREGGAEGTDDEADDWVLHDEYTPEQAEEEFPEEDTPPEFDSSALFDALEAIHPDDSTQSQEFSEDQEPGYGDVEAQDEEIEGQESLGIDFDWDEEFGGEEEGVEVAETAPEAEEDRPQEAGFDDIVLGDAEPDPASPIADVSWHSVTDADSDSLKLQDKNQFGDR